LDISEGSNIILNFTYTVIWFNYFLLFNF
jgi:hypothetical protein